MSNDKIKIAYFIDRLIPGGTELQLVEQIRHLNAFGIEQYLFCLYEGDGYGKIKVNCNSKLFEW